MNKQRVKPDRIQHAPLYLYALLCQRKSWLAHTFFLPRDEKSIPRFGQPNLDMDETLILSQDALADRMVGMKERIVTDEQGAEHTAI